MNWLANSFVCELTGPWESKQNFENKFLCVFMIDGKSITWSNVDRDLQ